MGPNPLPSPTEGAKQPHTDTASQPSRYETWGFTTGAMPTWLLLYSIAIEGVPTCDLTCFLSVYSLHVQEISPGGKDFGSAGSSPPTLLYPGSTVRGNEPLIQALDSPLSYDISDCYSCHTQKRMTGSGRRRDARLYLARPFPSP